MEALSTIDATVSDQDSGLDNDDTYIVQGPKGVGKSTFAKMLVNKLLSQ
jgi:polynucleotide 5'-kinase involved in rRNA processing